MSKRVEGATDYHVVSITIADQHDVTIESTNKSLKQVRDKAVETFERVNSKVVAVEETDEMGRKQIDYELR